MKPEERQGRHTPPPMSPLSCQGSARGITQYLLKVIFLNLIKFKHNLIVAVGCLSKSVLKSTQICTLEVVCSLTMVKYTEHVYCINN